LELRILSPSDLILVTNTKPLSYRDLDRLLDALDHYFETNKGGVDYQQIADRIIKGCAKVIAENCPFLDVSRVEKAEVKTNIVSGLDDMIQYETKWCAWPDYGFVSMPDVLNFPQSHIEFMRKPLDGGQTMNKG